MLKIINYAKANFSNDLQSVVWQQFCTIFPKLQFLTKILT